MIAAGILILLGIVLDVLVHGFSGIHVLLGVCGLFFIIINIVGGKRTPVTKIGKSVLSLAALAITCLILAGLFPSFTADTANSAADEIKKAFQMAEKKSAVEAVAYLDETIQKGTWNRDLAFAAAEIYQKYGKFNDSISRYITMTSYVPSDTEVRYALAQSMIGSKDYKGAIDQLSYLLQLDPQNSGAAAALGDSYWVYGDNIRGIYYYKMAVNLDADSVEKRVKLAQAYADMHSDTEAMEEYRTAKDLAKTFDEEMLVYNGYASLGDDSSSLDDSQDKEAGQ